MPYCPGAYARFESLPAPERTVVTSARGIDAATGRYQVEADGAFTPMGGTAQRALLALAFDSGPPPAIDAPGEQEARAARMRVALEPLLAGDAPAIRINAVSVTADAPGSTTELASYQDLHTDPDTTVTL